MKGIVMAGGAGTRLYPSTLAISKQLLPIYDKPMIYYPLSTLMQAKIREVMLISTPRDIGIFRELLGDGSHLGMRIVHDVQVIPRGIADAFLIAADFIGDDTVCLVLGDNVFYGPDFENHLAAGVELENGAKIFGCPVKNPTAFGVVECDGEGNVLSIEEKPAQPKSNYAVPGLYFYDRQVVEITKTLRPSARGELEITAVNSAYLSKGQLKMDVFGRDIMWLDTGTHPSLLEASNFVGAVQNQKAEYVGCLEEIAYRNGWIGANELLRLGQAMRTTEYGQYLLHMAESGRKKA